MKALEARVTTLSSPRTSPAAAGPQSASREIQDARTVGHRPAATSGKPDTMSPAEQQQPSRIPVPPATSGAAPSRAVAPEADPGRADARLNSGRPAALSRAVPDLMTFSPAVGTRPPGLISHDQPLTSAALPAAAATAAAPQGDSWQQHAQPSTSAFPQVLHSKQSTMDQSQQPAVAAAILGGGLSETQHVSGSLPGSRSASPMPGMSFYDNAVFGSPTPTPSPQSRLLDPSQSLLSPGSSPRPQQQQQADSPVSRSMHADTGPEASMTGLSLHHNQLWARDTASISIPATAAAASISIPTTAVAASSASGHAVLTGAHGQQGLKSGVQAGMALLPVVMASSSRAAGQGSGTQPAPVPGSEATLAIRSHTRVVMTVQSVVDVGVVLRAVRHTCSVITLIGVPQLSSQLTRFLVPALQMCIPATPCMHSCMLTSACLCITC